MKKIEINEGSSIWQLVTIWGEESVPNDFCSLFWQTLKHLVFGSILIALLSALLGAFVGELIGMFVAGYNGLGVGTGTIAIILGIIFVVLTLGSVIYLFTESEATSKYRENISTIHQSWKEKYCPLVKEIKKD